jgi:hypothetical protein
MEYFKPQIGQLNVIHQPIGFNSMHHISEMLQSLHLDSDGILSYD